MKRIEKKAILFILLCFMPLFISAGTFENGKAVANKYLKENFEDDYIKYIISEDAKYGFSSEKGIFNVGGFNKGGFINQYEYELSSDSENKSLSWLYDANGYWSLTIDKKDNAYVIGKGNYSKANKFNSRIVEYVRNNVKVSGSGTYSNPWVIEKSYNVTIKANRKDLLDSINYNNKVCGKDSCTANILMNGNVEFYLDFKDGYEYDLNGSGTNLCNSTGYSTSSKKLVFSNVIDDVECYFNIKESEYTITFDANGGTLTGDNSKKVTYSKTYGTLPEPKKEGHVFIGWYTEKVNGNKIESSSILNTTGDKTLYAHWQVASYTVTFDGNGGTPSYPSKPVAYTSKYGDLPTAERPGYRFLGWYTEKVNGNKIESSSILNTTGDKTLYAHWAIDTVTVTYVYSNGQANITKKINYGDNYTLPTDVIIPSCKSFDGWYDESGNQITTNTKMTRTTAHTITAKWNDSTVEATASDVENYFSYTGKYSVVTDSEGWYIQFLTSGTLTMNACMNVDLSLVGGGGGGAGGYDQGYYCSGGAGGSAGYTQNYYDQVLENKTYTITIGSGGSGSAPNKAKFAGDGGETSLGSYTAAGGEGSWPGSARSKGGSGGGASGQNAATYIQGGTGGSNGSNGASTGNSGGTGQGSSTYAFASSAFPLYSGGGGGGTLCVISGNYWIGIYYPQTGGYGGEGGGARGGGDDTGKNGFSAAANTGGGGGGGGCGYGSTGRGGNGGSGIVLMRNKR